MLVIQGILQKHNAEADAGLLVCSLGQFSVYHENVKPLPQGCYEGFFELGQIKAGTVNCINDKGLQVTAFELVAELNSLAFKEMPLQVEEPVKTDEALAAFQQKLLPEDQALFGELWPLAKQVQLDPACSEFRKQKARLSELGYTYRSHDQTWVFLD